MLANIALMVGAYLFGSLPFAAALARRSGVDLSGETDMHIALWHKVSKVQASLAVFVDLIKGSIPMLVGFGFDLPIAVVTFSGVAAVAGQMWPPSPNWPGEKGNTTGAGVIITLALIYHAYLTLLALIPFAIGAALRYYSLASREERFHEPSHPLALSLPVGMFLGFAVAPIASWCSGQPASITMGLLALFIIILVRRVTCDLKSDVKRGDNLMRILANRFLFDQAAIDGTSK